MISKISLCLIDDLGDSVPIEESVTKIESKIDMQIADTFSKICFHNNSITDAEIKTAEKFYFAVNLQNYLKEINENASRPAND
jgi:hypothetical protein